MTAASWQIRKLGEICEFEGGSQPPKAEFIYEDRPGYIRFLQIRDFASEKNVTYIRQSKKNRLCTASDILIGRYGASVGKILTDKAGAYNVALMKTLPNLELLDPSWFYNFLISDQFQKPLLSVAARSAQAGFSKDDIYDVPVPVPPISEQQRIVAVLEEAFQRIATAKVNAEANIQNANELLASYQQDMFLQVRSLSKNRSLGEIANFRNGINFTKQSKGRSVPIIGVGNFQDNFWAPTDDLDNVTLDGELSEVDAVAEGDILTVRSNGNPELIGRCMLVGKHARPTTHSGFTIRIKIQQRDALPRYVCHFLKSREIRRKLVDGGNGVNIKSLNQTMLSNLVVPLPPIGIQHEMTVKLEAMSDAAEALASTSARKLIACDELKKALLQQAFSGTL